MRSLSSISDSWSWYVLCICALILSLGAFTVLLRAIKDKRNRSTVLIGILNLMMIAFLNLVLLDCGQAMKPTTTHPYAQFQYDLFNVPYFVFALIELLSCILLLAMDFNGSKYRSVNITDDSIQQSLDALPEGIAVYGNEGTVRLSNLKMNELSRSVTGKILNDANKFWTRIEKEGTEQNGKYFIHASSGKVWLLEKEKMTVKDEHYHLLVATDVTERYAIIEELEKKNEHLQDIRNRMKAVSELSGDMFIAQEEANARAALHNQLGQVLLMGRHYINHKDLTDPKIVFAATLQMNRFLLGEAKEPYKGEEDALSHAVSMANSIGVKVNINGQEPVAESVRRILSKAITECAANTVKHAEGDEVFVAIKGNADQTEIIITNNGKPPKGELAESGGLLSLRRDVEAEGGIMVLESTPEFKLNMKFSA